MIFDGSRKRGKNSKRGKSGYFLLDLLIFAMDPLIFDMKINEILRKTNGFTRILMYVDQKSGYGEVDIAVIYNRILTFITTFVF